MYDLTAIESINVEQLATATDRLLLRGRVTKRRPSTTSFARIERPTSTPKLASYRRAKTIALMASMFTTAMIVTTLF